MSRFLRIYLLAIALPAVLLAVFGAFLLRADARARAAELAENRRWQAERLAACISFAKHCGALRSTAKHCGALRSTAERPLRER